MKSPKFKIMAIFLAAVMVFSACGGDSASDSPSATPTPTPTQSESQTEQNTEETGGEEGEEGGEDGWVQEEVTHPIRHLRLSMTETPTTFNPHKISGSYFENKMISANLYQDVLDVETGATAWIPDLADGYPVMETEDRTTWTLKVKPGRTFEDGTPIDAYTVEYTWKMCNDPNLLNRNATLNNFVDGEAYIAGEIAWEDVRGFKVLDQYTIQVIFTEEEVPVEDVDVRITFGWIGTALVHPATYEASISADGTECSYGTSLDTFVASGPFRLSRFIEGQYYEYEKRFDSGSPLVDQDIITADRVSWIMAADTNTAIQLFDNGEIDSVGAGQAQYDDYPDLYFSNGSAIYGIFLNPYSETNPILQDPNFRYALFWGNDRETIMAGSMPQVIPTAYFFADITYVKDPADPDNSIIMWRDSKWAKAIRMDGHEVTKSGYNPDLALDYFEKAYEANGGQPIKIEMQYFDGSEAYILWAQAVQEKYMDLFGRDRFTIELRAVPWSIVYENIARNTLAFEMMCAGGLSTSWTQTWGQGNWVHSGPHTWNTQYTTLPGDYATRWDELYYKCETGEWKFDLEKKIEAGALMEEIQYNAMTFIPCYSGRSRLRLAPWIDPVVEMGGPDFGMALWQTNYIYDEMPASMKSEPVTHIVWTKK